MGELFKRKKGDEVVVDHVAEARSFKPLAPSVNIIPPKVVEQHKVDTVRKTSGFVGAVLATALVAIFAYGTYANSGVDEELSTIMQATTQTQAEAAKLSPYKAFYREVELKRESLHAALVGDTKVGEIFSAVTAAAAQNGVSLSSVNISLYDPKTGASTGSGSCPSPDPFVSVPTAGCVDFSGEAPSRQAIAAFVKALNNTPGFVNGYVPSSSQSGSESGDSASVTGSVGYTADFYSTRHEGLNIDLSTALGGDSGDNTETQDESTVGKVAP